MQFVALLHDLITIDIEKVWEVSISWLLYPSFIVVVLLHSQKGVQLIMNETYTEGEAQSGVETDTPTSYQNVMICVLVPDFKACRSASASTRPNLLRASSEHHILNSIE